jgi:hypothetical protein
MDANRHILFAKVVTINLIAALLWTAIKVALGKVPLEDWWIETIRVLLNLLAFEAIVVLFYPKKKDPGVCRDPDSDQGSGTA